MEARLERIESQLAALTERLEHSLPEPARRPFHQVRQAGRMVERTLLP